MDPLLAPVEVAHVDLAEVMLRELARQALEPHQGGDRPWTQSAHRLVQRRLRSIVAQAPQAVQNLDRLQLRLSREHVDDPVAILLDHARPSDAAHFRRRDVPEFFDPRLAHDPLHAAQRNPGLRCDPSQRLAPCSQHLHPMSGHGSDHPPLPPDAAGPPQSFGTARYRSPSGGHIFRKGWGQNFRNPQSAAPANVSPRRG